MAHTQHAEPDNYPELALPLHRMQPEYDVVVVGSGYGAGVAASRMARAGKTVAVLELGWEKRPGSFPHTLLQCLGELSISGSSGRNPVLQRRPFSKDPTRLFQLALGDGQHAFCAHGLGGGSLINAGVFLEADRETLQRSPWPAEIRENPSELQSYYASAAKMLQPSIYPENSPTLKKLDHLQEQARLLGQEQNFSRVPVTTFFAPGRNHAGVEMNANRGSGHECTGLNDGSKNTVATTYLTDAWYWGAEIFCGCDVRYVEKVSEDEGYVVHFAHHTPGRGEFREQSNSQLFWVKARDWCFLGAGALGTTEILLRSRDHGLQLSPMVGRNMSGNGDLLIFGYNGNSDINGISGGGFDAASRTGPTVTGVIDNRANDRSSNPLKGYVVQDGCIPEPFAPVIQIMLILQTVRQEVTSFLWHWRWPVGKAISGLKSILMGPYTPRGAIQRTSTYLVMSHDSNELTLTLKGDKMLLRGPSAGGSQMLKTIKASLDRALSQTRAGMGYSYFYGRDQEEVTVHILGGANMSRNDTGRGGVTNHMGQVYAGHGSEVYPGLVCCDASVIPTSLGVNPLATITALAERSITLLTDQFQIPVDTKTRNGNLDRNSIPKRRANAVKREYSISDKRTASFASIGWQFTELLHGYISTQPNVADFAASEKMGKGSASSMRMFLTIELGYSPGDSGYEGRCIGTVSCRALSRSALKVVDGRVSFFQREKDRAESTTLTYSMRLVSIEGPEYYLQASKNIDSRAAFSVRNMWKATTSVNAIITRADGSSLGRGVLSISLSSFWRQMQSFRPVKTVTKGTVLALIIFLAIFMFRVLVAFLRPVVPEPSRKSSNAGRIKPATRPSGTHEITARDGVKVLLDIYEPQTRLQENAFKDAPPVLFIPGITGIQAAHNLYALPFQRCNMVEYFTARGCRCYVVTPRWSCDDRVANASTVFDARLDVAAALQHIHNQEGRAPYVVAHCQGSVALGMGILDGVIQPSQVLGVTANSVFINQVFGYWNGIKGATPVLIRLYEYLAGSYFPITHGSKGRDLFQNALDLLLRLYPVSRRRDVCTSAACHRTSFAFGLLWNHDNLDAHLHDNVDQFFAGTHTKCLEHIVRMGTRGQCLDNELNPLLTRATLQRLQNVPILWISGTENEVFRPESTLRDYELLRGEFGERLYQRFLAEGYGHLDPIVGKNAAVDVYWRVLEHVRWCVEYQG